MPPHCDTMDGPVVIAAKKALNTGNVNLILPYAPKEAETEIKKAFEKTIATRKVSKEVKEIADYWFFETVVRLHREGEGASYTGLKPAGLPVGPVIPLAEEALETGFAKKLTDFLSKAVTEEINKKLDDALNKKKNANKSVDASRDYVKTMLGFEVWSHHLYQLIRAKEEHEKERKSEHEH